MARQLKSSVSWRRLRFNLLQVWEADAVYLTMWDLSMLLCVLWDLSAILCSCPHSWRSYEDVPVFLRDLSPATRQENIGLDREREIILKSNVTTLDQVSVWVAECGDYMFGEVTCPKMSEVLEQCNYCGRSSANRSLVLPPTQSGLRVHILKTEKQKSVDWKQ
ncbi:hypothetical protein Bbelb_032990 [Branchiostoma belcheri]|nr:hypothetical protein Bbelb_032990 [Branchiostoma belcheri]